MSSVSCVKGDDGSTTIFIEIPVIKRVLKIIKGKEMECSLEGVWDLVMSGLILILEEI